jgi:hypothetical protein
MMILPPDLRALKALSKIMCLTSSLQSWRI